MLLYLGNEDGKFQRFTKVFPGHFVSSIIFWHIWLAGLLACFRFDLAERQLQRVNQIINHAITMKWSGG